MISVILINYHTEDQLRGAIESVSAQKTVEHLEVIVVNNGASDNTDTPLKEQLPHGTIYIQNTENVGFARACNQAFARSRGEYILLLNPDARLLPCALSQLSESLKQRPDAGAVGPRVFWDENCRFLLPPSTFPSVSGFYTETISRLHPMLASCKSLSFRKKALQNWTCATPITVDALSGGHILLRREAILKSGGLFDERFFMYWEDTDLMQRLKQNGYRLYMAPKAGCLHLYEHSPAKDRLIAQGWAAYQQKHLHKNINYRITGWLNRQLPATAIPHTKPITVKNEKLIFHVPPELTDAWLLELGTTPHLIPAIGHFGSGPAAEISTDLFKRLQGKIYYARLSAPISKPDLIYHWHWQGYSP